MKKKSLLIASVICLVVMAYSAYHFAKIEINKVKTEKAFDELRDAVELPSDEATGGETAVDPGKSVSDTDYAILPEYQKLYSENRHFAGWISIDGTNIDYPVMQVKDAPQFYLRRAFDGTDDIHGVPFIDADCDIISSDNYIVYGHRMNDGTMFADFTKFIDASYCEQAPLIRFDTIYERGLWRVVAVFKMSADDTSMFPYNSITDFGENETAQDYVSRCKPYAIWLDEKADVSGEKLLTLSTCEYSYSNGRLVVVAVKEPQ